MPPVVIYGAMVLGVLSATSFRVLTIVETLNPALVRPLWYFGVLGYIVFFAYRLQITQKRRRIILANRLQEKICQGEELGPGDRDLLCYVLSSVSKSKENINYLFIVTISIIVVIVDLWLTYQGF
ncbi:MAG: hypothetical protein U5J62_01870 [Desulfurivibrio sp.]|nr:hypothetical protein [Desulfurivibrio sp.]